MTDILEYLYYAQYLESHKPSEECMTASRKMNELLDRLCPELSGERRDELWNQQAELLTEANLGWVREGFRLGASLLLELL